MLHWSFWVVSLFVIIFLRYLAFSYGYDYTFRRGLKRWFADRVLHPVRSGPSLVTTEILRSAFVSLIFAAFGILVLWLWQEDYTLLYLDISGGYGWCWLFAGPLLFLLAQETYYYWVHRWMHRPGVYERVHRWHHESIETTVWTAFSFHPIEALLQAVFLPLVVMIIPMHAYAFLGLLALMTLSATINHSGIEVFPRSWARHPLLRYLIGATHHDVHHRQARYHFGLYFTFWDRWMGTEKPGYNEVEKG